MSTRCLAIAGVYTVFAWYIWASARDHAGWQRTEDRWCDTVTMWTAAPNGTRCGSATSAPPSSASPRPRAACTTSRCCPATSSATIAFYQDVLEFPLTELFENRDYQGSTHFFFDIGNGNLLAFFDFPGLDLGEYAEVLGGLHHLALSVEPARWQHLKEKLDAAGVPYEEMSGASLYFHGPDGERLELISDPLGRMYGEPVG